ncbi:MAG: anaerobic ribonucleoside-triphosphate reductase activating protein [Campylobacterales bacterium]|nr:anaerobic ribonucleoside-triphosphate reductase activating protein [Campylobacterales bacterium]
MKALYDITPFTLLDFPDTPAAIFWFSGCNLRCVYCYNPDIVFGTAHIDEEEALAFLRRRQGLLEGVVLSGGECTTYPHLLAFCRCIKTLGYTIKLDTNGMRPDVIAALIDNKLIDYIALDYKAPESKMGEICGSGSEKRFWESFKVIRKSGINFEIRTTFHPELLSEEDIIIMSKKLKSEGYNREYYVQIFQGGMKTIGDLASSNLPIDYEKLAPYITLRS